MTLYKPWAVGGYEMHRTSGVPVYVDGRKAGTAKVAVTRHYACDGPVNRVELTEFDGTLGEKHLNLIGALDEARNSAQYWKLKYSDVLDRDETINALKAEVERLKESRKEQAEKHRQKMRNLQQNFEAREQAKNRNTQLQRQVKSLTRALETSRADAEYWHGRRTDLASENRKLRQKHDYLVDALNAISHTVNDAAERQDGGDL